MHRHISESHHRKFYRERLRYATDVDYWNSVQKENVLNDMIPLAPWGDFNAQDGWAGYVPCQDYLVVVFLKLAESNMDFMRRSMQMLDAQILAGDASLKVPKFIRLSGGAQATPGSMAATWCRGTDGSGQSLCAWPLSVMGAFITEIPIFHFPSMLRMNFTACSTVSGSACFLVAHFNNSKRRVL